MNRTEEILNKQREYFASGATLPIGARETALKKLYIAIKKNEDKILEALKADLGKSNVEAFMCEVGMALDEISHMLKNIRSYARTQFKLTPLSNFHADSLVYFKPYGNVLIMSPWNYPFLLAMAPLVEAIAAGNTVICQLHSPRPATAKPL